jgi:hypothetical protein
MRWTDPPDGACASESNARDVRAVRAIPDLGTQRQAREGINARLLQVPL